jgi:hypothetical protein
MFDYSDAPEQRSDELIPAGTVATLQLHIRPGHAGEGGLLTRSKDGTCEMLDLEFIVVDGPYIKRKLWERYLLSGTTAGQETAVNISRGKLRAILESGRNIKPDDMSEQARKARTANLSDFAGVQFIARIGIEKGKPKNDGTDENYSDRNVIATIITPDKKDWHVIEQAPPFSAGPNGGSVVSAPATISKPAWAHETQA